MSYDYCRTAKVVDYDRRKFADVEDARPILESVGRYLRSMEDQYKELDAGPPSTPDRWEDSDEMVFSWKDLRAQIYLPKDFARLKGYVGFMNLIWSILQTYRLPAKDRKLIEKASKEFSKTRIQSPKRGKGMVTYRKKLDEYQAYYQAAERAIRKGDLHTDEGGGTTVKAGPFTLINTGGFSDKQMSTVAKVVEQAAKLVQSKGQGKICYGEIQVTSKLDNKTKAFYTISTDAFFVRATVRGDAASLSTVIHELGHRLHFKFLKGKDAEIKSLYNSLLRGESIATAEAQEDKSNWPQPGEEVTEKNKVWVVDRIGINRQMDRVVHLHLKDADKVKASIALRHWLDKAGKGADSAFVSAYAKTDHQENFAEMFAHYCLGTLDDGQAQVLKSIL